MPTPLIDGLLARINQQSEDAKEPGFKRKTISRDARKLLTQHNWPGNIRELENTLRGAAVWSDGEVITPNDIKQAFLPTVQNKSAGDAILNQSLEQGIDLPEIIASVGKHYLQRAMEATNRNKSKAAHMLGLPSHQTLTNWLQKYGVK
jgi:DNA-binding NtrC family response regulator